MPWRFVQKWWPYIWPWGIFIFFVSGQLLLAAAWVAIPWIALFWYGVQTGMTEQETLNRKKHGRCLHCGYSLRENLSGICPECGAATSTVPKSNGSSDQVQENSGNVRLLEIRK
jgi:hypothetical protein